MHKSSIPKALPLLLMLACGHTNPPITREIRWADARTEELARRACYDCHSNETVWPWYSWVPPVSWIVKSDVRRAREKMNFSEWDRNNEEAWEAPEELAEGEMPLPAYVRQHEEADLSRGEKRELIDGFERTFAADPPRGGHGGDEDEDEEDDD